MDNRSSIYQQLFINLMESKHSFKPIMTYIMEQFSSHFYVIIQSPEIATNYHIFSSSLISFQIHDDSYFSDKTVSIHNLPTLSIYNGVSDVKGIAIIPIQENFKLVLCRNHDFLEEELSNDIIQPFISLLASYIQELEVDVDYSIAHVESYSPSFMTELAERSFNVLSCHPSDLLRYTFAMYHRSGISTRVGIDPRELLNFIVTIRHHYNLVPYHNWFHALDVTQFVYSIITHVNLSEHLLKEEVFALLLSAIAHDTEHNGLTNNYHRKTNSIYAQLAQDLPPLEHHHSEMAISLSKKMLSKLPQSWSTHIGNFVISCIMATNMEFHKQFLDEFKEIQGNFDKKNPKHRLLLAQIILKAADLSNTVRDFDTAQAMSLRLQKESFRQGEFEKERNLPLSPMCDKDCKDPLCKGQIGFYKFVAEPLMNELHTFFPQLDENAQQFAKNLKNWEEMYQKFTQEVK